MFAFLLSFFYLVLSCVFEKRASSLVVFVVFEPHSEGRRVVFVGFRRVRDEDDGWWILTNTIGDRDICMRAKGTKTARWRSSL